MGKLLPILLALIGLALGGGAGFFLRPAPSPPQHETTAEASPAHGKEEAAHSAKGASEGHAAQPDAGGGHGAEAPSAGGGGHGGSAAAGSEEGGFDYVKMNNQFIVPLVEDGRVRSLVILTLSLEVQAGAGSEAFGLEPKLRDVFLQVLFDHANSGGFSGNFTQGSKMQLLRDALLESARRLLGAKINDVLIVDIVRQDA